MALATDSVWQLFLFSGIGSVTAELATVPIDVVKTRMQLQGELGAVQRYRSSLHAFPTIVRDEGFLALYKGVQPAVLRQATYGSVRIGLYEPIKAQVSAALHGGAVPTGADGRPAPPTLVTKLLSGVLSGAVASGVFTPMDVVKVRMQAEVGGGVRADGAPAAGPRYRNVLHALRTIAAEEGRAGLYKGVSPTMQRAAVVAAVELASYDECKTLLVSALGMAPTGAPTHLAASLMAGFLCTLASSPLDVIKSRVMNQPVDAATGRGVRYSSTLDCLRKSVAAEGVASLWKGFWPNFGRIGPHCIITFMTIERLRNWAAERKAAAAAARGAGAS